MVVLFGVIPVFTLLQIEQQPTDYVAEYITEDEQAAEEWWATQWSQPAEPGLPHFDYSNCNEVPF
jgi:hypothetical protein